MKKIVPSVDNHSTSTLFGLGITPHYSQAGRKLVYQVVNKFPVRLKLLEREIPMNTVLMPNNLLANIKGTASLLLWKLPNQAGSYAK